jgi:pyruvate,water dikinase
MEKQEKPSEHILHSLQERAKELNCLYQVEEILSNTDEGLDEVGRRIIDVLPAGYQHVEVCRARLTLLGKVYAREDFVESEWRQAADINVQDDLVGEVEVFYDADKPKADEGPFLKDERRLINAVAERLGLFILQRRLRSARKSWESAVEKISDPTHDDWSVILDFIRRTDRKLLARITRKMINHLCWAGVAEAQELLQRFLSSGGNFRDADENRPLKRSYLKNLGELTDTTFLIALQHYSEEELLVFLHTWIDEDKTAPLVDTLENPDSGLAEITDAVQRFESAGVNEFELPVAVQKVLRVSLLRRLFSDQPAFINVAKNYVEVRDFYDLLRHIVHPSQSHGKLGGKGAGLFLAWQVVKKTTEHADLFKNLRVPKTWFVSSDSLRLFMHFNNLEDIYDKKYTEIEKVRQDYPHIVQLFKNSQFPAEIVKQLSAALDDFENRPLIVRSSSLLEDRVGAAFSGKYKSLFLANQGSKKERLEALQDAIAEVYASVFGPDPIEYRTERGLIDVHEEMGIMIQEVVGVRVGKYYLPAFAGVGYSNNEFRWSARIKRDDGLLRMVPGLGTRAVDRIGDDYPVLLAPGQPGLRVNVTADEVIRYSPRKMDVMNLETNAFETIEAQKLLKMHGDEFPAVRHIVSIVEGDRVRKPVGLEPDWEKDDVVVTFQGLFGDTKFVQQARTLMTLLCERLAMPVDIEFAHDGKDFYLLQCRAQSYGDTQTGAPIPRNLPRDKIIFSANRHISNGRVPDITHIVYVDPEAYSQIEDWDVLRQIGRAVGRLNQVLPKRQFILMGPGRWGSRGDIKLGVDVTYSDINNTAVLLEMAKQKGNYVPELSFGTHFFQDLVEADIRYIPLYPDDPKICFNELFLRRSRNILADVLPEYEHLSDTLRVIDVPQETEGQILRVLMNADLDEAVGVLDTPTEGVPQDDTQRYRVEATREDHWRWRLRMAEVIAQHLDPARFGVRAFYVFGSTKNTTAGPGSDVDIIVHFTGSEEQRDALMLWLEGWSRSLAEVNYLRTGYRMDGLLDIHYVTDDDIAQRTSFAAKIDAVTDAARSLPLGRPSR